MRILVAHSFYRRPGGEGRYVEQLLDLLRTRHDVEPLSESNELLREGPSTAQRMLYSPGKTNEVKQAIARFKPDVIHVHNVYPALGPAVHLAARRSRVPIVLTVHNYRLRCPNGYMFTEGAKCRRCVGGNYGHAILHDCFPKRNQAAGYAVALWFHRFVLRLERDIAHFIAPSQFVQRLLLEWGMQDERVSLVRHPIEPSEPSDSLGEYGLFLGRLSEEKSVDVLLRALAESGDPPFRIVGDGPMRASLETLAHDLRLTRTHFTGWISSEEARAALLEARYVVIPSSAEETASLAALEAIAAGRPILGAREGALRELEDLGNGLGFNAGDVLDMARQIKLLVADDVACKAFGEQARSFAQRELEPTTHLSRLESVYERSIEHFHPSLDGGR